MQQLSHPAYMQQQQQQWPIPPLWYNNSLNMMPWTIDYNTVAATQSWQPQTNVWNTQQPQPMAQRPMPLPYVYKATAAASAQKNHCRVPESDEFVSSPPSQPRPVERVTVPARIANAVSEATQSSSTSIKDPKPLTIANSLARIPSTSAEKIESRSAILNTPTVAEVVAPRPPTLQLQPQQNQLQDHLTKQVAKLKDAPHVAPESETAAAAGIAVPDFNSRRSTAAATGTGTNAPARRGKGNTCVTRGEQCALDALAQIFPGKEFAKVRPDWLINDRTSRALELDLYNHELRLAIEHSGLAHYCFPNRLHKTREEFDAQVYRDSLKRTLCARAGVLLIEIPFTVPHATMQSFIRSEIDRLSDEHEPEL